MILQIIHIYIVIVAIHFCTCDVILSSVKRATISWRKQLLTIMIFRNAHHFVFQPSVFPFSFTQTQTGLQIDFDLILGY